MKKTNVVGMAALISGGLLWGYVGVNNMMAKSQHVSGYGKVEGLLEHKSLYDSLPEGNFDWIGSIPWPSVQNAADSFVHLPLWMILMGFGIILLVIGGIFIKK